MKCGTRIKPSRLAEGDQTTSVRWCIMCSVEDDKKRKIEATKKLSGNEVNKRQKMIKRDRRCVIERGFSGTLVA